MVEYRAAREAEADRMTDEEALAILEGSRSAEPGGMGMTLARLEAAGIRAQRALRERVERGARA